MGKANFLSRFCLIKRTHYTNLQSDCYSFDSFEMEYLQRVNEPSQNTAKADKIPRRTEPRKVAYTMQESGNPTPMSASYYNAHLSIYLTFMIVPLAGSS